MNASRIVLRIAACVLALACTPALAQYSCSVSTAGTVNFLTYNPSSATPALASTQTTLTCTHVSGGAQSIDWTMTLTNGNSANCNARTMTRTGDSLQYNIYQDSIAGGVWGNPGCATFPAGNFKVGPGTGNNSRSVTKTLYGRIPISQFVSAGTYNDTLVLTISY
jgi:spore coat protein U-like protein